MPTNFNPANMPKTPPSLNLPPQGGAKAQGAPSPASGQANAVGAATLGMPKTAAPPSISVARSAIPPSTPQARNLQNSFNKETPQMIGQTKYTGEQLRQGKEALGKVAENVESREQSGAQVDEQGNPVEDPHQEYKDLMREKQGGTETSKAPAKELPSEKLARAKEELATGAPRPPPRGKNDEVQGEAPKPPPRESYRELMEEKFGTAETEREGPDLSKLPSRNPDLPKMPQADRSRSDRSRSDQLAKNLMSKPPTPITINGQQRQARVMPTLNAPPKLNLPGKSSTNHSLNESGGLDAAQAEKRIQENMVQEPPKLTAREQRHFDRLSKQGAKRSRPPSMEVPAEGNKRAKGMDGSPVNAKVEGQQWQPSKEEANKLGAPPPPPGAAKTEASEGKTETNKSLKKSILDKKLPRFGRSQRKHASKLLDELIEAKHQSNLEFKEQFDNAKKIDNPQEKATAINHLLQKKTEVDQKYMKKFQTDILYNKKTVSNKTRKKIVQDTEKKMERLIEKGDYNIAMSLWTGIATRSENKTFSKLFSANDNYSALNKAVSEAKQENKSVTYPDAVLSRIATTLVELKSGETSRVLKEKIEPYL